MTQPTGDPDAASRASVLICLDSFKGSIDAAAASREVAFAIERAAHLRTDVVPYADGGEGTVDALAAAGWAVHISSVEDAFGVTRRAKWARQGDTAVIELAQVASIVDSRRSPADAIIASTFGVGQLVARALDDGCTEIVLALGGSSTSDGGAGMLAALGASFSSADGPFVPRGAVDLERIVVVDLEQATRRIRGARIVCATDVTNPLLGATGAAAVYGPQKGAGPSEVEFIERGLASFTHACGARATADIPGAGAAGGTGFGAILGLRATVVSGAEFVAGSCQVAERARRSCAVIVGEGCLDSQTLSGKGPGHIAGLARAAGVPCYAIAGRVDLDVRDLGVLGVNHAVALTDLAPSAHDAIAKPAPYLREAARRLAPRILAGL